MEAWPLREDLRLFEAAPERDGSPSWSIQDPVTNRFFRIGWLEFECLLRWPGSSEAIAMDISRHTPLAIEPEQVAEFIQFLARNQLLRPDVAGARRLVQTHLSRSRWNHWRWWLHHYLFFRIPLLRPAEWLQRMLPWVRPLGSRSAWLALALLSAGGLLLVARQWEHFSGSVAGLMSPQAVLGFALAVLVAKTAHELGHALVATHHGVRVAHMGVAFMVMWPMLYTDTGESWKLRSHRSRLQISSAGMAVELGLAGLATLAWALVDDGPLRQALLYLATTGWVLTLLLNLSPFMRFDGYFVLSDLLDFPNLHERSANLARVGMRRLLLGWQTPWPERFPPLKRRALIGFALATWTYRALLFLGIAVAVYLFFFKVLGLLLFALELAWFLLRPVAAELAVWRQGWGQTVRARKRLGALALLGLLLVLAVPWRLEVHAPAYAHSQREQRVYSPYGARLLSLHVPAQVAAGATLASFENPDLAVRAQRTEQGVATLSAQQRGVEADDAAVDQRRFLDQQLAQQQAEMRADSDEASRLTVAAEFAGQWLDVDTELRPGVWVHPQQAVGTLVDPSRWVVDAFVEQGQVERLQPGAKARFVWHGGLRSMPCTVIEIDSTRTLRLPFVALDAAHGGPVATLQGDKAGLSEQALYRVRLALDTPPTVLRQGLGHISIQAQPASLLWLGLRQTFAVILRESGF